MNVRTELTDLIRAIVRQDWGTVDQLTSALDDAGWPGGPQVIGAAFAIVANRRFRPGYDVREVTRFVAEIRDSYEDGRSLPALETEAIIRAALGEVDLADSINVDEAIPAQIVVLGKLLHDENLSEEQLEGFIAEVRTTAERYM